jgi:hypothetical protein
METTAVIFRTKITYTTIAVLLYNYAVKYLHWSSANLTDRLGCAMVSISMCTVNLAEDHGCAVETTAMYAVNLADDLGCAIIRITTCSLNLADGIGCAITRITTTWQMALDARS